MCSLQLATRPGTVTLTQRSAPPNSRWCNRFVSNASSPVRGGKGDLLVLDNHLTLHGRKPFTGAREILVAMA